MAEPTPPTLAEPTSLELDFENTAIAFDYKTDAELSRSHFLFRTIQNNFLVNVGPGLVQFALRIGLPITGLLKHYLFNQFCGGTTLAETDDKAKLLYSYGVTSILDYAVEAVKSAPGLNAAKEELLKIIDHAKARPEVSHVAMKMTGIGLFDVMAKKQAGKKLSGAELIQYDKMVDRLEAICAHAHKEGQSVLIDAEESWIQDIIDELAEEMMWRYNQERPTVYTTVQMYRHDRLAYLEGLIERAKSKGAIAAVKLVRGAYLEKENDRAEDRGYPTPMQPDKASTDRDFNAGALLILDNLEHAAMCAGTHNEASSKLIAQEMERRGLDRQHPHVFFSQLYGMSDHIGFNLAAAGFNSAKYLPYGPVKAVLPYLFRRAQENTSIAGQTGRELGLVQEELNRRRANKRKALKPGSKS